jgi:hypothetical protein
MAFKDPTFADWTLNQFGNCGNEVIAHNQIPTQPFPLSLYRRERRGRVFGKFCVWNPSNEKEGFGRVLFEREFLEGFGRVLKETLKNDRKGFGRVSILRSIFEKMSRRVWKGFI